MQGPLVPYTPSPDSDGLPFHPKYLNIEGYKAMSFGEFKLWLHDNPCAPPLIRSQLVSAGSTQPISPSAPDSPVALVCYRLMTKGQY
jgi:hypothetical protein